MKDTKLGWAAAEGLLRRFGFGNHGEGGWLDAAMAAAAIGLTACTVWLCAADEPDGPPLKVNVPSIILHEMRGTSLCRAAERDSGTGRDVHISLDRPDPGRLVKVLAGMCRERRIPPERIFAHRQVDAGCPCGSSIHPELLVGQVRREMMR